MHRPHHSLPNSIPAARSPIARSPLASINNLANWNFSRFDSVATLAFRNHFALSCNRFQQISRLTRAVQGTINAVMAVDALDIQLRTGNRDGVHEQIRVTAGKL